MADADQRQVYLHFVTGEDYPMSDLYVEVAASASEIEGVAVREIGFDQAGRVVHRTPSDRHRFGLYGLFDRAAVRFPLNGEAGDCSADEFEVLWGKPDLDPPPTTYRRATGLCSRLRQVVTEPPAATLNRVPQTRS